MTYLLDWEAAAQAGPTAAGGKGWNLGRLHHFGYRIPRGLVIAAAAYWDFLAANGLTEAVDALAGVAGADVTVPAVAARLDALREAISQGTLPAALTDPLGGWLGEHDLLKSGLAVRSSATAEDGASASFAGIHKSFLNVIGLQQVTEAIKGCYASLWTPVAVAYRRKMGFSDRDVACAVVVQALVQALASGVVFSCDPRTGRRDRVVISAAFGLGESVVQGNVEADEYVLAITNYSMVQLVGGRIGLKHQRVRPTIGNQGGVMVEEIGFAERSEPAIMKEHQQRLALAALRIQDSLGDAHIPQDIEWAYDGFGFTILQARPVTALPEATFPELAGQPTVWSTANLKDALPGVQTPLGWWLNSAWAQVMLKALFERAGYTLPEGLTWSRLFKGRAYLNLSALQWAAWDAFGIKPAETNRALGGHQEEVQAPAPPPRFSKLWRERNRRLLRFGRILRQVTRNAAETNQRIWKWIDQQAVPADVGRYHDLELLKRIWKMEQERRVFLPETMVHNAGGLWSERLREFLERRLPGRGAALVNALLAGGGEITSAAHGWRLAAIARQAAAEPSANAYFRSEPFDPSQWFVALKATKTREMLRSFISDYGHRGVYEMEIANPRWREDPSFLLQTVSGHLQGGIPHSEQEATGRRTAAEQELQRALRLHPLASAWARFLLARARTAMRDREAAKSTLVKLIGAMRPWCLELGKRLVKKRLIDDPSDVFFLTGNDLVALAIQDWDGNGARALIEHRRARRAELMAEEAPEVLVRDQAVPRAALPTSPGAALAGVGVSAGRAAGRARLINHPDMGGRLAAGEVLVAPSTDPAWTPLFLRAAALVTEVGGYLSHGAIVAREYGVPAVVNVPGAMSALQDGEQVTVDGDGGQIYREAGPN